MGTSRCAAELAGALALDLQSKATAAHMGSTCRKVLYYMPIGIIPGDSRAGGGGTGSSLVCDAQQLQHTEKHNCRKDLYCMRIDLTQADGTMV